MRNKRSVKDIVSGASVLDARTKSKPLVFSVARNDGYSAVLRSSTKNSTITYENTSAVVAKTYVRSRWLRADELGKRLP